MLPTIKVYKIDYEFILKNYTSPALWDKTWTLFVFKNYVYTLSLNSIDVKNKNIIFEIKLDSNLNIWCKSKTGNILYNINNMSIDFLMNTLIPNKMRDLSVWLEAEYIEQRDPDYRKAEDAIHDEREVLREIASSFLDNEGVTNDEIREAYIDYYVDKNEEMWNKGIIIKEEKRYTYLTDLYLILAEINKDEDLKEKVLAAQNNDISELTKSIKEFVEKLNTDEYIEEMENNLEAI